MDPTIEMIKLIASKAGYYLVLMGLLLLWLSGYSFGWILLGFLIMHFTSGLVLTTIFQLAHLVEDMDHPQPEDGVITTAGPYISSRPPRILPGRIRYFPGMWRIELPDRTPSVS